MDYYDIHGICKIATNTDLSLPDYFKSSELREPDLTVTSGDLDFERPPDNEILKGNYYFWRSGNKLLVDYGFLRAKLSIEELFGSTEIKCTKTLRRLVSEESWRGLIEAILSMKLIQKGCALTHSGGVARSGEGALIVGMCHTGKTSVVLSLLGNGFNFMGDDWVIHDERGRMYSYPKKINISPRTLTGVAIPEKSFKQKMKEEILKFRLTSVLAERFLGWNITRPVRSLDELVADVRPLRKVFVLKGYGKEEVRKIDNRDAASLISSLSLLIPNLYETYLDMYYYLFNVDLFNQLKEKDEIIKASLNDADCFEVTAPRLKSWPELIGDAIERG